MNGLLRYDAAKCVANCHEHSIMFRMPNPEVQYHKGDVYWDDVIPREDQRAEDWLVLIAAPDGKYQAHTDGWPP